MKSVRALKLTEYGGIDALKISSIESPQPCVGQVLVRVLAAGINGLDWKLREGYVRETFPLRLPTILGVELAGIVEEVGPEVSRFRKGDRVMGPIGGLGAYADLVTVTEANLIQIPDELDDLEAAALPLASVAAWKSLHLAGPIVPGQRILIHGAAGGLGGFAVQFAHQAGAEVYATALESHASYVQSLGADKVLPYDKTQFENLVSDIDLVLDYAGGDVLNRSWGVLSANGAIVSAASPNILKNTPAGNRGIWYQNAPDIKRLKVIAQDVANGQLKSKVSVIERFEDLPAAIERHRTQPQLGKTVVTFTD